MIDLKNLKEHQFNPNGPEYQKTEMVVKVENPADLVDKSTAITILNEEIGLLTGFPRFARLPHGPNNVSCLKTTNDPSRDSFLD